jgi:hypothetical protein
MLKLFIGLLFSLPLWAFHSAEVNINEKDFEGALMFDIGQFNESLRPDTTFVGASYIKGSESHSDFSKTEGMIGADFLLQQAIGAYPALTVGMGVKYRYVKVEDTSFSAIPIGLELKYAIPVGIRIPIHVGGMFYYSPEVLSFDKAKNYIEYRLYGDVELIERGHIVVGYRNIDTNFKYIDRTYNDSWFFGFRFQF